MTNIPPLNQQTSTFKLTILVNDHAPHGLTIEHGLAFWIETDGRHILFDTGQGKALEPNALALGIDLSRTDILIISHGHYDHTGAMELVLKHAPHARIYAHPGIIQPRYSIREGVAKPVQIPDRAKSALEKHPKEQWIRVTQPVYLSENIGITGPIPRLTVFEDPGGPFFLDPEGRQPDPIVDDQALWVRTSEGTVVIVGCCHSGLINTLTQICNLTHEKKIRAVIGGLHLLSADTKRLSQTFAGLREIAPGLMIPCHCTGDQALKSLLEAFGNIVEPGMTGNVSLM
ncbi:MAG: MBL fold metallo-hydrolase [Candidatus Ozemobacteraceae bacterium]